MTRASLVGGLAIVAVLAGTSARASADETTAVRGRIVDATSGRPFARATVVVRDDAAREIHLTTDRDGRYVALGLLAGSVEVTVAREGFAPESQVCRVADGDTLRLDFSLVDRFRNLGKRIFACRIEPQTADRYVIE